MSKKDDFIKFFREAHRRGAKMAQEISIRTGVPLVIEKNGKIIEVKPKYKYIKVPIKSTRKRLRRNTNSTDF